MTLVPDALVPDAERRCDPKHSTPMITPIPGIVLMSSGETRIKRNRSQTAAQTARQDIDAVRNDALNIP